MRGTDCRRGSPLLVFGLRSIGLFSGVIGGVGGGAVSMLVHNRVPMRRPRRIHRTTPRPRTPHRRCHRRGRSLASPSRHRTTNHSAHRRGRRPCHTRGAINHGSPYPYNDKLGCGGYRNGGT